ncbi:212_t:CDS:2, partial [Funneliformis mosseae]
PAEKPKINKLTNFGFSIQLINKVSSHLSEPSIVHTSVFIIHVYGDRGLSALSYTAWRPHTPHITVRSPYNETKAKE